MVLLKFLAPSQCDYWRPCLQQSWSCHNILPWQRKAPDTHAVMAASPERSLLFAAAIGTAEAPLRLGRKTIQQKFQQ